MGDSFKRVEKKYLLTEEKVAHFFALLGEHAVLDQYGLHTICNIYYDTAQNDLIRRSIDRPIYKEKFRLRSYGVPDKKSDVFLEIKKKYNGTVYKRRIKLPYQTAMRYLEDGVYPDEYDCQIMKEIDSGMQLYHLQPALFLAYDRMAYYYKEQPDVRFTVDRNIRYRRSDLNLLFGDEGIRLHEEPLALVEMKAPGALPLEMTRLMSENDIFSSSFSKYGRIYKKEKIDDVSEYFE
ncbi:MAG: polyphosphate polymerase domain-containing protein [Lachnospiraceae bacterium]|nr:polyphosphate polymerase domain-containing protein [Lachnospiraceae bacterium]